MKAFMAWFSANPDYLWLFFDFFKNPRYTYGDK